VVASPPRTLIPIFRSPQSRREAAYVAVAVLVVAVGAMAAGGVRLGDEWVHYQQIEWFAAGRYEVVADLTTIPGFHAVVAAVWRVFHSESLALARGVTMAFGLLAAFGFARIRRALFPDEDPWLATLQYAFFPILFPFCFLVYTDVPSLALVLWAFRYALDRRHRLAGALCIAALLFRQTNIVWVGLIVLLQAIDLWRAGDSWRERLRASVVLWPYAVAAGLFAAYWLWHGTLSMSRTQAHAHPDLTLHSGNLFLMLFVVGLFFLPLLPLWLARYARAVRARPALLAVPLLLGLLYAFTFKVDHPYNLIFPEFTLHNGILVYVAHHRWASVAFGAVAMVAGCAVSQVRWQRPAFALVLPASILFVSASWLIEQRYYLIPVALLLALRRAEDRRAERLMLAFWIPVAVGFTYGMQSYSFFL